MIQNIIICTREPNFRKIYLCKYKRGNLEIYKHVKYRNEKLFLGCWVYACHLFLLQRSSFFSEKLASSMDDLSNDKRKHYFWNESKRNRKQRKAI